MLSDKNKTKPCMMFANHAWIIAYPVDKITFPELIRKPDWVGYWLN